MCVCPEARGSFDLESTSWKPERVSRVANTEASYAIVALSDFFFSFWPGLGLAASRLRPITILGRSINSQPCFT